MRHHTFAACIALAATLLTGCQSLAGRQEGETVRRGAGQQDVSYVGNSNQEMNAAMDTARRTATQLIAVLKLPKPTQDRFMVKVHVTDDKAGEYMWLKNLTYDGSRFHGQLMDDPYEVKGYHMGQDMAVAPSEIADWMYYENGVRQGGYTEKVIEAMEKNG